MLILRESTISTFDIVKVKKHELVTEKTLRRSKYNYFVKKNGVGFLWNTASDACVLLNETEAEWYDRTEEESYLTDLLLSLYNMGFYVEADLDERFRIDLLRKRHAYSYPENGHIDIEILPTQHCNARCFYCFEQKL